MAKYRVKPQYSFLKNIHLGRNVENLQVLGGGAEFEDGDYPPETISSQLLKLDIVEPGRKGKKTRAVHAAMESPVAK